MFLGNLTTSLRDGIQRAIPVQPKEIWRPFVKSRIKPINHSILLVRLQWEIDQSDAQSAASNLYSVVAA